MKAPRRISSRGAAALVSMIVILVAVATFAGVFLNMHDARISIEEAAVGRLRAQAAALAATHITLWQLKHNTVLQADLERVVYERDTSYDAPPLYEIRGELTGTIFHVSVWPGDDAVRLKARGISGGSYYDRWTQIPLRLAD